MSEVKETSFIVKSVSFAVLPVEKLESVCMEFALLTSLNMFSSSSYFFPQIVFGFLVVFVFRCFRLCKAVSFLSLVAM